MQKPERRAPRTSQRWGVKHQLLRVPAQCPRGRCPRIPARWRRLGSCARPGLARRCRTWRRSAEPASPARLASLPGSTWRCPALALPGHLLAPSPSQGSWRPSGPAENEGPPRSRTPVPALPPATPEAIVGVPGQTSALSLHPEAPSSPPRTPFLFQLRAKRRPQVPGKTCPPRRSTPSPRGVSRGGRQRTADALSPLRTSPSCSAAGDSAAAASSYCSDSEGLLPASRRLGSRSDRRPWGPCPQPQSFT